MVTDKNFFFPETIFWCCPNISHWFPAAREQCYYCCNCCYPRYEWRGCLYFLSCKHWWCGKRYKWTAGWCNDFSWVISHSLLRRFKKYCILIFVKIFVECICFKISAFTQKERWKLGLRWRTTCLHEIAGCYWACPKCKASNIVTASKYYKVLGGKMTVTPEGR